MSTCYAIPNMRPPPLTPPHPTQELVQVESIAQLGVYLLLFGLGMELNLVKLRSVLGVSILGEKREEGDAHLLIYVWTLLPLCPAESWAE